MAQELTHNQERFCQLYVELQNAESAHQEVYGYSRQTGAWTNAGRLLQKPKIQARILQIQLAFDQAAQAKREELVERLLDVIHFDPGEVLDWDDEGCVRIKPRGEWTKRQTKCISKIRYGADGRVQLDFLPALEAAKQLAQMCGWLNPDMNVQVNNYVIRAPEAVPSSEAWEAMALQTAEAEHLLELRPEPAGAATPPQASLEAERATYARYPEPATSGAPGNACDAAPLTQCVPSGRSADELQVLPAPTLRLGWGSRRY